MPHARRWFVTLSVVALAAACGGSAAAQSYDQSHTATQIANDSASSVKSVKSEHVKFDGTTTSGQIGFEADVSGQDFNGTITMSGQSLKVIAVGGKVYVYGPDILTVAPISDPTLAARVKALVGTNWVVLPNSSTVTGDLSSVLDMSSISTCITSLTGLKKKGTSTIEGDAVVEVDDSSGGQLFVLIASPHYPRRFVLTTNTCPGSGSTSSGSGTFDLTKVNATFTISAPTNVVDLTSLGISGG